MTLTNSLMHQYRAILKSVRMRGVTGTAMHVIRFPLLSLGERRHLSERLKVQDVFDKAHGLDTSGIIRLSAFKVDSANWVHGVRYAPTSFEGFKAALGLLRDAIADPGEFTFVDIGSGKGPVLLYAADLGFKAIYGVEFVRELHEIANRNLERYASARGRAVSVLADATTFEMPAPPLLVYFNFPFSSEKLMAKVIENISRCGPGPKYIVAVNFPYDPSTVTAAKLRLISTAKHQRTDYAFEVL